MPQSSGQQSGNAGDLVAASIGALVFREETEADTSLIAAVRERTEPIRIPAGEILFAAGDESDAAYVVVTGRLLVLIAEDGGEERIVRRLGRGEIVGEVGLLDESPRSATVVADRDSTLARLPRADFDLLAGGQPGFLAGVTRTVVRRLAQPRPPVDTVGTIAVAVAHPDLDGRVFVSRLTKTLEGKGSVQHLSSAAVAAAVGDDVDALHIDQYLDEVEAGHRFVVLETDGSTSEWSRAALRRADRVLVIIDPDDPRGAEFAELARGGHRPDIWVAVGARGDSGEARGSAALAARYQADRVIHFQSDSTADIARVARLASGTGTALVLGGGGARGFAHIGVYRAMTELGIPVDAVAGASIGGIIGAGIATAPSPDELTQLVKAGFSSVLDYTLPVVSMVKGSKITREIDRIFSGVDFEDLSLPFLCVSTNLTTGEEMVHDQGPVTVATRAGLAIPGVIPPVPYEGDLLVDGGVLNNLPVGPVRATGLVDTVIAVEVAPRRGPRARKDYGMSVSGWGALGSRLGRRKPVHPGISAVLLRSMIVGSLKQRDDLVAARMVDLMLTPDLRGISLLAFDKVESVADAGYETTFPVIEEWLDTRTEGRVA